MDTNQPAQPVVPAVQPVVDTAPVTPVVTPVTSGPVAPATDSTPTIVSILLLILAYPIGVIVMWFWPKWSKIVKIVLTVPLVLGIVGLVIAIGVIGSNPNLRKGLGVAQLAAQCASIKDEEGRNACVGEKVMSYMEKEVCGNPNADQKECAKIREGIKAYTQCLKTGTAKQCMELMQGQAPSLINDDSAPGIQGDAGDMMPGSDLGTDGDVGEVIEQAK